MATPLACDPLRRKERLRSAASLVPCDTGPTDAAGAGRGGASPDGAPFSDRSRSSPGRAGGEESCSPGLSASCDASDSSSGSRCCDADTPRRRERNDAIACKGAAGVGREAGVREEGERSGYRGLLG